MGSLTPKNIQFFESQYQFREWLEINSHTSNEVWVGFYKKETGKPSLTWSESVDQALCFGWIDGIRKSFDSSSYVIRFTPRNPKSIWSNINIKKVETLIENGLMKPEGLKAFKFRNADKSGIYSFELNTVSFEEPYLSTFMNNSKAWDNFCKMPPSYQKAVTRWVLSAKREETQVNRLKTLIKDSEAGNRVGLMQRNND